MVQELDELGFADSVTSNGSEGINVNQRLDDRSNAPYFGFGFVCIQLLQILNKLY